MQIISSVGAALILWAFVASSYDKMDKNSLIYGVLNFFGAGLLAVTLVNPLNLGALVLETIWCITGFLLIIRTLKRKA